MTSTTELKTIPLKRADGSSTSLGDHAGKVVLVNRQGEIVGRFAPHIAPDDARLAAAIDAQLQKE
jgi:glutathione peroxidase-family protein